MRAKLESESLIVKAKVICSHHPGGKHCQTRLESIIVRAKLKSESLIVKVKVICSHRLGGKHCQTRLESKISESEIYPGC